MTTLQTIIVTSDLDRLLTFYTSLLGGVETMRTPEDGEAFYMQLQVGDSELGLVSGEAAADAEAPQRVLLSAEVSDVDALLPVVESLGGTVLSPPNDMPWGQRVVHIKDPDGNAVNLTQNL